MKTVKYKIYLISLILIMSNSSSVFSKSTNKETIKPQIDIKQENVGYSTSIILGNADSLILECEAVRDKLIVKDITPKEKELAQNAFAHKRETFLEKKIIYSQKAETIKDIPTHCSKNQEAWVIGSNQALELGRYYLRTIKPLQEERLEACSQLKENAHELMCCQTAFAITSYNAALDVLDETKENHELKTLCKSMEVYAQDVYDAHTSPTLSCPSLDTITHAKEFPFCFDYFFNKIESAQKRNDENKLAQLESKGAVSNDPNGQAITDVYDKSRTDQKTSEAINLSKY